MKGHEATQYRRIRVPSMKVMWSWPSLDSLHHSEAIPIGLRDGPFNGCSVSTMEEWILVVEEATIYPVQIFSSGCTN